MLKDLCYLRGYYFFSVDKFCIGNSFPVSPEDHYWLLNVPQIVIVDTVICKHISISTLACKEPFRSCSVNIHDCWKREGFITDGDDNKYLHSRRQDDIWT